MLAGFVSESNAGAFAPAFCIYKGATGMADTTNVTVVVERIMSAAGAVYNQMLAAYAAEQVSAALQPGGAIYEKLMSGAIAGALAWYGMYTPLVYQRGMTMSDPGNIVISGNAKATGSVISGTAHVANVSPHAGFSYGFDFYRRGELFHRPGGDLMQSVPKSVQFDVDVPQDVANTMFLSALKAVL